MDVAESRTLGGGRAAILWLCVLFALLGLGCAKDFETRQGSAGPYLEHREIGYYVAEAPVSPSLVWVRTKVPGADLAYRNEEGTAMSLASRCRETRASVAALARQLTIGTERDELLAAGPLEHAGQDGWSQTFDTQENGLSLRIKAITLLAGRCTYDWLLVAPGPAPFERAEPSFDAWMRSFVPPPTVRGPEPPAPPTEAVREAEEGAPDEGLAEGLVEASGEDAP
jgi:hypothetical protein